MVHLFLDVQKEIIYKNIDYRIKFNDLNHYEKN